jgi:hypothetical protein
MKPHFIKIFIVAAAVLMSLNGYSQKHPEADAHLLEAAYSGKMDSVKMALADSANVNAVTTSGVTSLMYAAQGGFTEIVNLLIERGADPDLKPYDGRTALITAASIGQLDIAETLIRAGAHIDLADKDGATALMHAAAVGDFYMTDMLIYYKANVNLKADDSTNALMLAAYGGHDVIAGRLLKQGSKTDEFDNKGFTAVLLSTGTRNTALTDTLYKYQCNFNRKLRFSYISPLDMARIKCDRPVARMIRKYAGKGSMLPFYDRLELRLIPADFNFTDYMMGCAFGIFDSKFNTSWNIGISTRVARKSILEQHDGYYLQLREQRRKLVLGFEKMFVLPGGSFELRYGPFVNVSGLMSWGNYEGLSRKTGTSFLCAPGAGFAYINGNFNFRLKYSYENYHLYKVSPHRVELSAGIFMNLPNHNKISRTISWL